jgi:nucleoside-diphosphate-sugar epimerase
MTKILITGANGFIGRSVFRRLIDDKVDVYGGARHATSTDRFVKTPDLTASSDWVDVLKEFKIVVHTAGRAHVLKEKSDNPLEIFRAVNTAGTIRLAKDCASAGVRRFIYISSIGVYGRSSTKPLTEKDALQPVEDYAISKMEAEKGLLEVGRKSGMEIVIIRPPLVYGTNAPGNFGMLFNAIVNKVPLPFGSIRLNRRTFVSLDNLTDLVVRCIFHPKAANQIFLAADNETLSTAEFICEIGAACGIKPFNMSVPHLFLRYVFTMIGKSNAIDKLTSSMEVSNRKALSTLGWSPPYTMRKSLQKIFLKYHDEIKN